MMSIIEQRLQHYPCDSKQAELNALKEIAQEIALTALARTNFFKHAQFQGGTCLRIVHNLPRFSEDLGFILNEPNQNFNWHIYLNNIETEFNAFGLSLETIDRSKADQIIKKAFLKDNSFGKVLTLRNPITSSDPQTFTIKLEIDTNPPIGSTVTPHHLSYPYPFSIVCQDLPSLFAGKCHALLSRAYIKGRDWYDLTWYLQNGIPINKIFLYHALQQSMSVPVKEEYFDRNWLVTKLAEKINQLDWKQVAQDVSRFLPPLIAQSTHSWNADLFLSLIQSISFN